MKIVFQIFVDDAFFSKRVLLFPPFIRFQVVRDRNSLRLFFDDHIDRLFHFFGLFIGTMFWMLQTIF
ncbi:hypothetical protein C6P52_04030 [Enterococcus mundtii]|nr:hypothetical protein C6P52_04030 [Enterococcus mundtii]PTO45255.1 hypothetical protein C6P54_00905 [Enterococcus mundtii]